MVMPVRQRCPKCGDEFMGSDAIGDQCPACWGAIPNLRDRCKDFIAAAQRKAITRTGSPVEDLMAFVQSEIGRTADASLEETKPMILYFGNEQDRDEFMAIVREAKPGMVAKSIP